MATIILGVNCVYHESSACILRDGELIAAAEEERFTRVKHAKKALPSNSSLLPYRAIAYCLEELSKREKRRIQLKDVAHVGFSFEPERRVRGNVGATSGTYDFKKYSQKLEELIFYYYNRQLPQYFTKEMDSYVPPYYREKIGFYDSLVKTMPKWHFIPHHLCHAASAYLVSPFESAAILTVDGIGETTTTWAGTGAGNKILESYRLDYPNSLGFFYERIAEFLGFQKNNDEFKVTALAPYGKPVFVPQLRKILTLCPEGRFKINNRLAGFRLPLEKSYCAKLLGAPRNPLAPLDIPGRYCDIAASAQYILEEAILHICRHLRSKTGKENLCLAGGVALNCVANARIAKESGFRNVFVQPAANDAGTALGAACYIHNVVLNKNERSPLASVSLGPDYSNKEILQRLTFFHLAPGQYKGCSSHADIASTGAGLIQKGKLVGWFQGRMEFGPRALGNRSILADPRSLALKTKLNVLKSRGDFHPFAASVLADEAIGSEWFDNYKRSPFMLFAFQTKKAKCQLVPAAIHIDGTSRIQTVEKKSQPLYYGLIKEFYRRTGVPMVVNTSFNLKGQPIVCTVDEAIQTFFGSALDALIIGKYVLTK